MCLPTTLKQRQEHSHGTHLLRCVPECTRPSCSWLPVCVPASLVGTGAFAAACGCCWRLVESAAALPAASLPEAAAAAASVSF